MLYSGNISETTETEASFIDKSLVADLNKIISGTEFAGNPLPSLTKAGKLSGHDAVEIWGYFQTILAWMEKRNSGVKVEFTRRVQAMAKAEAKAKAAAAKAKAKAEAS